MIPKKLTLQEILAKFEEELEAARTHYVYFKWSDHARKLMTVMNDPDRATVICTDFGSLMETLPDMVDNNHLPQRLMRAIYFVYSGHRKIT